MLNAMQRLHDVQMCESSKDLYFYLRIWYYKDS